MLPVCRAVDLASRPVKDRWLIEDLWGHRAAGTDLATALRGSIRGCSELHAWGDSNLYVRAKGNSVLLAIEHRTAADASGRGRS